jgi:hypothetical protein
VEITDFFDPDGKVVIRGRMVDVPERTRMFRRRCNNGSTLTIYQTGKANGIYTVGSLYNLTRLPASAHVLSAVDLETFKELRRDIDVETTASHKVRTCGDFQFDTLINAYAYSKGKAVMRRYKTSEWAVSMGGRRGNKYVLQRRPKCGCINSWSPEVEEKMQKMFPTPSSFEKREQAEVIWMMGVK